MLNLEKKKFCFIILFVLVLILFFINNKNIISEKFVNKEQDIFVELEGGLCNKIRTIVGFNYLARKKNVKLYTLWEYSSECPGYFEDLFYSIDNVIILRNKHQIPKKNIKSYYKLNDFKSKKHNLKNNEHLINYKNLKIKNSIKNEINNFIEKNDITNSLGLHIRRTDHIEYLNNNNRQYMIRDYDYYNKKIEIFQKSNNHKNVFIATDNLDTQKYYRNKYPNIIFLKFIKPNNNLRKTSLEDALKDIIILSKCKYFKGTVYSSFSNLVRTLKKWNPNILD